MYIVLVEANDSNRLSIYTSGHIQIEPLGIEYIGAVLSKEGYKVTVLCRNNNQSTEEFAREILANAPDIVGLSVLTYNFDIARDLSRAIKTESPKTLTVFGGYHPTSMPQIVKDGNIDVVVIGEGEYTFLELVKMVATGGDFRSIKGIAYYDRKVVINRSRDYISDLNSLPWPLRTGIFKSEGLLYPPVENQKGVAQVTYSRGCPYQCSYCNSPVMQGKTVRWRSATNVVDEIQDLQDRFDIDLIYFTDLTFNVNKRKVIELSHEITDRKARINWFCGCRPDNMDAELIQIMKEAGCCRIHYGIESFDEKRLKTLKRFSNIERIKKTLELTCFTGIISRGYLMIGYPWQTKEDLQITAHQLKSFAVDDLRISFLTPFPGTQLFERFKRDGLLATEDFSKYTTDEPVVKVKGFTREELIEMREQIFKEFYKSKEYEQRMKEKIRNYPHLKQSYDEFFEFLDRKGVFR